VGIPPDSRRADETRSRRGALHGAGDPACRGHRSGAAPAGPDLAAVPARSGRRDPRGRPFCTWTRCCLVRLIQRSARETVPLIARPSRRAGSQPTARPYRQMVQPPRRHQPPSGLVSYRPARCLKGPPQVIKRSAETGAAPAKPRAGSTMAGRCLLPGSARVHDDTPVPAGFCGGPRTMRGPDRRSCAARKLDRVVDLPVRLHG
jgi:hypothetical protein